MEETREAWPGPLGGIKVLDLTRVLSGPFATQILGDLGAEVFKIEAPGMGDETRGFSPMVEGGESHYFLAINRSKKSLVVDIRKPEGAEIIRGLAARADVLVENFRPGVLAGRGLGYEALSKLNPRLIYCAITGFGLTGPLRDTPSFDVVTQALTGALSINGDRGGRPVKLGLPIGDMVGGVFGPIAILSALHERAATGRGRLIDISLFDGLMGMLGYLPQLAFATGEDPAPMGTAHPSIVPYGSFAAADGEIIVACLTQAFWERFAAALGRADLAADPRYRQLADRRQNRETLEATIADVMRTRTVAEWQRVLTEHDVPHAPILSIGAAVASPHAAAREMVVTAEHPTAGEIRMIGRPIKFPGMRQADLRPPPLLGQHTAEVLASELGYSAERIAELRALEVIDAGKAA